MSLKGTFQNIRIIALACKTKCSGIASFLFICRTFPEYLKIWSKKFTDRRIANTIQLFVAITGNFCCPFFFLACRTKGKFPRDYLIIKATYY